MKFGQHVKFGQRTCQSLVRHYQTGCCKFKAHAKVWYDTIKWVWPTGLELASLAIITCKNLSLRYILLTKVSSKIRSILALSEVLRQEVLSVNFLPRYDTKELDWLSTRSVTSYKLTRSLRSCVGVCGKITVWQ